MAEYIIRRCILMIVTLIGLSALMFFVSRVAPADPARLAAGPRATPEMVQRLTEEFGLDQPLLSQYVRYMGSLVKGNLGTSIRSRRQVSDEIADYFPATLELVVVSLGLASLLAIPLGVLSAVNKDRLVDHMSRFLSTAGVGMPAFWLAIVLQLLFVARLDIFPLGGRIGPAVERPPSITGLMLLDSLLTGNLHAFASSLHHIFLPALALSFPALASLLRLVRADVLDVLHSDFVRTARAKGLPERRVIWKHVLRNALISTVAMIGLRFGWMLGTSVLVETIFDWPGLGLYMVQAITFSDFEPIVGSTLIIGLCFAVANLIVDLSYGWLDPRIRYD